ncbi:GspH/FimT family pseudopilin, partial [Sedimenticola sp.]|uniref:GspH/FimT family pseudopilin n=1 Tax=Sedimenticola sp. TaxID=1940285 RepID=UPI003D0D128B
QVGFTLIELLVTIAIAAILLTVAVPSFSTIVKNNRLVSQANEVVTAMLVARSESVKRGGRVAVCASANPTAATPTCATAPASWESGWVVFVDSNSNQGFDAGEEIIQANTGLNVNTLRSTAAVVSYVSSGSITPTGNTYTITLCDDRGASEARAINVRASGRAVVERKNVAGGALVCP